MLIGGIGTAGFKDMNTLDQWFPTFSNWGVPGQQLPETLASTAGGQGFWELQSKNTWVTQG